MKSFANSGLSKDLYELKPKEIQKDFLLYIAISIALAIYCLVTFLLETDYVLLAFFIVLTIICIRYFLAWKISISYLKYFNFFTATIIYATAIYSFSRLIHKSSPTSILFFSYCLAQLQQILQNRVDTFRVFFWSRIIMLIIRTFIIGRHHLDDLVVSSYFIHIGLDLILIGKKYKDSVKERSTLKQFSESRQEFSKFKELLTNHLPQNIMVLNHDLTPLFVNSPLQKTFGLEQHDPVVLKEQIRKLLDSLEVEKKNLHRSNMSTCVDKLVKSHTMQESIIVRELVDYLVNTNTDQVAQEGIISFESFADKSALRKKLLFQVTMFNMIWDNEDAFVVILDDVTDREEVIALKVADTNKDRVIATLSHELRTPLNGILGLIKMALQRAEDPDLSRLLELCENNGELLLNIVNSMLDLHQIRQGTLRLNPSHVEIEEVLKELKTLFEFQCIEKDLYIKYEIQENTPKFIMTDKNRLKQTLINLISNAIKFTFQGGITIKVEEEEGNSQYLVVSVCDTGVGIKEKQRKKLFKMYGKLEETGSVSTGGIGLGLTISNNLARMLSEQRDSPEEFISIDSQVGKGSTFSFRISKQISLLQELRTKKLESESRKNSLDESSLDMQHKLAKYEDLVKKDTLLVTLNDQHHTAENPLLSEGNHIPTLVFDESPLVFPKPARLPSKYSIPRPDGHTIQRMSSGQVLNSTIGRNRSLGSPGGEGPWILVVDDNPFNLLIAQGLLEGLGFRVKVAMSGEVALEMVKKHVAEEGPFKMILMDLQMPIMDGFETARELRAMMDRNEIPKIPIVALTANDTENDLKKCFESGMEGHLVKPLKEDLFRAIYLKLN